MSAQTGLTVVKRMTYRGDANEEYSNTYWFTGGQPSGPVAWRALFDALVLVEKPIYGSTVNIIKAYGYTDNEGHRAEDPPGTPVAAAVWSLDLRVAPDTIIPGTMATTRIEMPGDDAVWVRWKTSRLTSPGGKAIYLRKYFHPALTATSPPTPDTVLPQQVTALQALGTKLRDGSFIDARTLTAPGKTDVLTSSSASPYVTTRTLKRRGKRPKASS